MPFFGLHGMLYRSYLCLPSSYATANPNLYPTRRAILECRRAELGTVVLNQNFNLPHFLGGQPLHSSEAVEDNFENS